MGVPFSSKTLTLHTPNLPVGQVRAPPKRRLEPDDIYMRARPSGCVCATHDGKMRGKTAARIAEMMMRKLLPIRGARAANASTLWLWLVQWQ